MRKLARDTIMTPTLLAELIKEHNAECVRYNKLYDLYNNSAAIFKQNKKPANKPDNRIAVNHAKYIVDTFNGYFCGNSIKLTHENEQALKIFEEIEKYNDSDDNMAELARLSSIFGRAYELIFRDDFGQVGLVYLDPREAFIVYDNTIREQPLFAVRVLRDGKKLTGTFSDKTHLYYFDTSTKGELTFNEGVLHTFEDVPMVEYRTNDSGQGLYESVVSLIDSYNKAISEKANDVDYFADAYMKILGKLMDEDTLSKIRDSRIINLEPEQEGTVLDVDFLARPESDKTQENFLDRIERLIYQTTMVANINDTKMNDVSGQALKYKLHAMQNVAIEKKRRFVSSMTKRWRIICGAVASPLQKEDWVGLGYTFTWNAPSTLAEDAQLSKSLFGIVSRETLLSQLSCVDNAKQEIKRIEDEERARSEWINGL